MEIIVAKTAGFCFGVKLAVDRVYKETDMGRVYTYGPIIHNKEVTNELQKKGVQIIENFDRIDGGLVVLRSHGVPPDIYCQLDSKNIDYVDCTCPDVKKIHKIVENEHNNGKAVIIIGNSNHPEIIGIKGWAGDKAIIFSTVEEVLAHQFDKSKEYSVVIQTTFVEEEFDKILECLTKTGINLKVFNTICRATSKRQQEANEISKNVTKMIVIGDKSSSNSKKLYEICKQNCKDTYFIETIHDLELNIFSTNDKIGVTAGASTPPAIIKEAIKLMSDFENSNDQSFEEMLNETFVTIHTGDIVTGTVISVSNGEVSVNLGYKSDGLIPRGEFSDDPDNDPAKVLKPDDKIEVFVVRVNDGEGNVQLSRKRVEANKGMAELEEAANTDKVFKGKIVDVVKGGLIAVINGIRAFVPSSQISNRFVEDMNEFKGKELEFNILEVDKAKRRIIAGRKELAKKEVEVAKSKLFENIEVGSKINGTVSRIVDFGAFVDLGGVDGLIHISEISWGRVKKVSDILKVGDEVTVSVLEADKEKSKISLSLKDIHEDPWKDAETKYAVGNIISAKVVRLAPFGAFIELQEGVDGLVHISQISHKRVEKPENELSVGQIVDVKVTELDVNAKKISLSIKATIENDEEESTEAENTSGTEE